MAYDKGMPVPDDLRTALRQDIEDAVNYVDGELSPDRADATKYYRGDLFGDEVEGRSKVVVTVLRDVVTAMLPGLIRVFAGTDRAAEFIPTSEQKVKVAEQATDYVNHVVLVENNGVLMFHTVFKDALVRNIGVVTWYWETRTERKELHLTGVTQDMLALMQHEGQDVEVVAEYPAYDSPPDPQTGAPAYVYDVTVRKDQEVGRCCVQAVPPDEFLINRSARSIDTARYVGHKRKMTIADLVALGYDKDEILEHAAPSETVETNIEAIEREAVSSQSLPDDPADEMMREVEYVESYFRHADDDGVPVLYRICTVGDDAYPLFAEIVDDVPFADFCPDPEPHTMMGSGYFARTKDLQRIMSHIVRSILDSLTQAVNPRTGFVEGAVNIDDLLNPEVSGLVRMTAPGMVQPITTEFVGKDALPVLELFDGIKEDRTGVTRTTSGLNADALQSSTRDAVNATLKAAEQQVELVARLFAEGGLKRMMRGVYKTLRRNQQQEKIVRLRGEFVPVNPAEWEPDLDVQVHVGIGSGKVEDKLALMGLIVQKIESYIQTMGPDNQLAGLPELYNALRSYMELSGRRDVHRFFKDVKPGQPAPQPQQPPQPSDAELLAQVEMQKLQADTQIRQQELRLKELEIRLRDDRERDKLDVDMELRAAELSAKTAAAVDTTKIKAMVDRQRHDAELAYQAEQAELERQHQKALAEQQAAAQAKQQGAQPAGTA